MPQRSTIPVAKRQRPAERTVADAMLTVATVHGIATSVGDLRTLFDDDHVHAAVIVADGVLITVIERADLKPHHCDYEQAVQLGTLSGRVVAPDAPIEQVRLSMLRLSRRRLAVIDADGVFRGLLCLKRTATGFCSDNDVRARSQASPRSVLRT